nr:hypothetical protein [uncultured Desulfobulbus sp.]
MASPIVNFRLALQLRNFEITQLYQRNNFFMIFQGVLLAGSANAILSVHADYVPIIVLCITGLIVSILQVMMAGGAKFWQEYWEEKVSQYENELYRNENVEQTLFHADNNYYKNIVIGRLSRNEDDNNSTENNFIINKYSVSRIPIYTGITFSFAWLGLLIYSFYKL